MYRIKKAIKNPKLILLYLLKYKFFRLLPDKLYIRYEYFLRKGKKLNLKSPKTYNEKLQWLKIHDRKPEYTDLVDKYKVREIIADKLGKEYLIPLYGVYSSFDEIDFEKLPRQFVLKPNHTSGNVFICKDKSVIDYVDLEKNVNDWLKREYFWLHREWPYRHVKPLIISEAFLIQDDYEELRDYRFFCFNGEPKFISVDFSIRDKKKTRRNLYTLDWELMDEEISYRRELKIKLPKPKKLDEMIELSRKLSKGIPHVRIDFYYIDNKIYFGEMTFYHQSGMGDIRPVEFNDLMGSWIKIPEVTN